MRSMRRRAAGLVGRFGRERLWAILRTVPFERAGRRHRGRLQYALALKDLVLGG